MPSMFSKSPVGSVSILSISVLVKAGPFHLRITSGITTKKCVEASSRFGPDGIAQTVQVEALDLP